MRTVKNYTKIWKYEKFLFAIRDIKLIMPVSFRQMGFFFTIEAFLILIDNTLLFFMDPRPVLYYILLPCGITFALTKYTLDGKTPLRFVMGTFVYYLTAGRYSRYTPKQKTQKYKYGGVITYRRQRGES